MEQIVQCKVKKGEGKATNQRIYFEDNKGEVTLQVGVWRQNKFTNETSIVFDKKDLIELLKDGKE